MCKFVHEGFATVAYRYITSRRHLGQVDSYCEKKKEAAPTPHACVVSTEQILALPTYPVGNEFQNWTTYRVPQYVLGHLVLYCSVCTNKVVLLLVLASQPAGLLGCWGLYATKVPWRATGSFYF